MANDQNRRQNGSPRPPNQPSRQQKRRPNQPAGRSGNQNRRPQGQRNVQSSTTAVRARDLAPPAPRIQATPVAVTTEEQIQGNGERRAVAIAAAPGAIVGVVILVVLAAVGLPVVGVVSGVVVAAAIFMAVWFGGERVLLSRLGGTFVKESDVPRAANLVDGLCATMGLPFPELLLVDDQFRGALVIGRNVHRATLVLTKGLLFALDPVELEGVLAHELSHMKTGDMASATMAASVMLPFAPLLSSAPEIVLKLAGTGRELRADRQASSVTRYPPGLRDALLKMAGGPSPAPPSRAASAGVGRVLRWLWTVVPDLMAPKSNVGLLDSVATRVAALDEA